MVDSVPLYRNKVKEIRKRPLSAVLKQHLIVQLKHSQDYAKVKAHHNEGALPLISILQACSVTRRWKEESRNSV